MNEAQFLYCKIIYQAAEDAKKQANGDKHKVAWIEYQADVKAAVFRGE